MNADLARLDLINDANEADELPISDKEVPNPLPAPDSPPDTATEANDEITFDFPLARDRDAGGFSRPQFRMDQMLAAFIDRERRDRTLLRAPTLAPASDGTQMQHNLDDPLKLMKKRANISRHLLNDRSE